jgi:hypothetical protein
MKPSSDQSELINNIDVHPENLIVRQLDNLKISFNLNFDLPEGSKIILRLRGGRNNKNDWYHLQPFDQEKKGFLQLKTSPERNFLPILFTGKQLLVKYLFVDKGLGKGTNIQFTIQNTLVQSIAENEKKIEISFEFPDGKLLVVEEPPTINIIHSNTENVELIAPSMTTLNDPFKIFIRVEDKYHNLIENFNETIKLYKKDKSGNRTYLKSLKFKETDGGFYKYDKITRNKPGLFYIEAEYQNKYYISNPIICEKRRSNKRIYWGYIHGHTNKSDGMRSPEEYFKNLKRAGLDFGTNTEHDHLYETSEKDFKEIKEIVENNNVENEFITIFGYEYGTWYTGYGDICIYYKDNSLPILRSEINKYNSTIKINRNLEPYYQKVLMIGHHTALKPGYRNWEYFNNKLERLVEIYSSWGNHENSYEDGNPLPPRYKFFGYGSFARKRGAILGREGSYVQDALQRGYKLGFTAGGDDHLGLYPSGDIDMDNGIYPPGIMAVWAEDLTRESIWNALIDRKCYGTTGPRIIIKFSLQNYTMGDIIEMSENPSFKSSREFKIKIISPLKVESVQIVRNKKAIKHFTGGTNLFEEKFEDLESLKNIFLDHIQKSEKFVYYYVRILLEENNMAWTSPIWIVETGND